jgi:hypothetical protein
MFGTSGKQHISAKTAVYPDISGFGAGRSQHVAVQFRWRNGVRLYYRVTVRKRRITNPETLFCAHSCPQRDTLTVPPTRTPTVPLDSPLTRLGTSACRVKGWHLRRRLGIPVAPRFLWECLTSPHPILVSIPCHLEPDVRFSLIPACPLHSRRAAGRRLSDSLLPQTCEVLNHPLLHDLPHQVRADSLLLLVSGIACAGVLVIRPLVWLALWACTVTYLPAGRG